MEPPFHPLLKREKGNISRDIWPKLCLQVRPRICKFLRHYKQYEIVRHSENKVIQLKKLK
jgi:hypothetical protein